MSDLECPYCSEPLEVCHDDGQGFEEDRPHEMECYSGCGKSFVFWTSISYDYSPTKADCLNGEMHRVTEWRKLWESDGNITEDRHCRDCGHRERRTTPIDKKEGAQ